MKARLWLTSFALAVGLLWVTLWALAPAGQASTQINANTLCVATSGIDLPGCGSPASPCRTVQYAVDSAAPGDEIHIAAGTYSGVQPRPVPAGYSHPPPGGVITQVVCITKVLTLRGGYTPGFSAPPDSYKNPTTLDAQGRGRVLAIHGPITVTLEGLQLSGGDARGLGGELRIDAGGGGAWVMTATISLNHCRLTGNTADWGAGLYVLSGVAELNHCSVCTNTATWNGGALSSHGSDWVVRNSTFAANTATWAGGALALFSGKVALGESVIAANQAQGLGGAALMQWCRVTMTNTILADNLGGEHGSGLWLRGTTAHLRHTTIARNSGGDGSAIWASGSGDSGYSTIYMTNTVLISHTTGITLVAGCKATLDYTLWHNVVHESDGGGIVSTGAYNWHADPMFAVDGYHLSRGSPAIDRGADAGVRIDVDRQARPFGGGYDLGADELPGLYLPLVLRK